MIHAILLALAVLFPETPALEDLLRRLEGLPVEQRAPLVEEYLTGRRLPVIEADTILTFVWYGIADSVFVNGALQGGWRHPERMDCLPCGPSPGGRSLFYKRYVVPRDARLEYQFIVDGKWTLDPGNVRLTANGDFSNSEAVMPGFVPTKWTAYRADVAHGKLDTLTFTPRDTTLRSRRVIVFIPPEGAGSGTGVSEESVKRAGGKVRGSINPPGGTGAGSLASVYVHDGETALRHMAVTTIIENMVAAQALPPTLAVFIPSVERDAEYVGRKQTRFINALADELVPLIRKRYGSAPAPARCGTIGISGGGHIALAVGLARPDVFGACAGQSATITPVLSSLLDMHKRFAPLPPTFRLYQQCGLFDIVDDVYHFLELNRRFHLEVTQHSIHHMYVESSDGHDWPSWRERVPTILRFFFMSK